MNRSKECGMRAAGVVDMLIKKDYADAEDLKIRAYIGLEAEDISPGALVSYKWVVSQARDGSISREDPLFKNLVILWYSKMLGGHGRASDFSPEEIFVTESFAIFFPEDAEVHVRLAKIYFKNNNFVKANRFCKYIYEKFGEVQLPELAVPWALSLIQSKGEAPRDLYERVFELAFDQLRRGVKIKPVQEKQIFCTLANIWSLAEKIDNKAMKLYKDVAIRFKQIKPLELLAQKSEQDEKWLECENYYKQLYALGPDKEKYAFGICKGILEQGQKDKVPDFDLCKRGFCANRHYAPLNERLLRYLEGKDAYDPSDIKTVQKFFESMPLSIKVQEILCASLLEQNKIAGLKKELNLYLKEGGDSADLLEKALPVLITGRLLPEKPSLEELSVDIDNCPEGGLRLSISVLELLVDKFPDDINHEALLVKCYQRTGSVREYREHLGKLRTKYLKDRP